MRAAGKKWGECVLDNTLDKSAIIQNKNMKKRETPLALSPAPTPGLTPKIKIARATHARQPSEDTMTQTAPTIDNAIAEFLKALDTEQSKSRHTVKTYRTALKRLREFWATLDAPPRTPDQITYDHLTAFARQLKQARLSASARETYLIAIHQFLRYAMRQDWFAMTMRDQERWTEFRRKYHERRDALPRALPEDTVTALLETARAVAAATPASTERRRAAGELQRERLAHARNVAIVSVLLQSGMRVGELVALKRGDLDHRARSAIVKGKGKKERVVWFGDNAWSALQAYLKMRTDGATKRALAELPLFARHDRRTGDCVLPLTTQRVEQIFAMLVEAADLDLPFRPTPHSMRHTFATRVLDACGDLAAVQDLLGHASPATTRRYARVSAKRLRAAHQATFGAPAKHPADD